MTEESLVALMIGRPLQLAFPERARRGARPRGAARGLGPAGRPVRPDRPRGREGRDPRHRRCRGQRAGAVPARARRCRAPGREGVVRRQRAQHEVAARAAPRRGRAAQRRPDAASRSSPSSASARTRRSRCCGRWDALGFLRPRARAAHGRRPRAPAPHPHGFDRAAGSVALGRQPAEGLADPPVPARGREGHPGRGADPGRRRRRALRHLRGAAREGGRGRGLIVKSSDPLELAGLCDRVVVMSRGKIVDEIRGDELGERRIVEAIVGSRPPEHGLRAALEVPRLDPRSCCWRS